jgi:hypothetical protein
MDWLPYLFGEKKRNFAEGLTDQREVTTIINQSS